MGLASDTTYYVWVRTRTASTNGNVWGEYSAAQSAATIATVSFTGLTQNGSSTETTTKLTLTLDKNIDGLAAEDITLTANDTGAIKGTLTPKGSGVYDLGVSGITTGGQVTVDVTKTGYEIIPVSLQVTVYGNGSAGITVAFKGLLQDENIDLGTAQILSWSANTALVINPLSGFDSYQWSLDGKSLDGQAGGGITLYAGEYRSGKYRLTVQAVKNGLSYSKTITFTIGQ
jgi:hypothetical protein